MAKRNSVMDDLYDFATRLPWWLCLFLAVASYFLFHHFATGEIPAAPSEQSAFSGYVFDLLLWSMSKFLQYLIPGVLILGTVGGAVKTLKRRRLLDQTLSGHVAQNLNSLTWREFEQAVGELFRRRGYKVEETASGADGGVDLVLTKGTETHLVQCKQWKSTKVGVDTVRSLFGVMVDRGAAGGYVVASGEFTRDAKKFVEDKNVTLVRASELVPEAQPVIERSHGSNDGITCPRCHSPMKLRTAKRGKNTGGQFYGCSRFPKCRATVDA